MDNWIKRNKISTVLILFFIIGSSALYYKSSNEKTSFVQTNQDKKEIAAFDSKVLSFESLNKVEKFEELSNWGLVAPEQYNHKSGKNLILLALKSNSFLKGDWAASHGLMGTNMLDVYVLDRIGYKSLFLSGFIIQNHKMYASSLLDDLPLLAEQDGSIMQTKSIIARREAAIYAVSNQLESRYIYDDNGNFGKNYLPEPNRKSNNKLKKAILDGLKIYNILLDRQFEDKTLNSTLCMGYASLEYDTVLIEDTDIFKIGPLQVCKDALKATLSAFNKEKDNSYNFLDQLGWEMSARELATDDKILLPDDDKNYKAMLEVIEKDIDSIKK